jgi:hypothetical protein
MANPISRRRTFAGLGLSMASVLPISRPLRAAAEPVESGTPDDRMILHLEPVVKSENAPLEVFCPGRTGYGLTWYLLGMLEERGRLKRSVTTEVKTGSIPMFLSGLWPASSYYAPIPHGRYMHVPDGESFRYLRDSDFHLRSEVMQGSAVARIADPWVVVHHDDVQDRFDRVVSSYSGSPRSRFCLIGSTLEFADQIKASAWTAQLCRNRTDTLISVVPCLAPATGEPFDPYEKRCSPLEAVRLLQERSDLTIQVQRSYIPSPNEDPWEKPDESIAEAISFLADFLCDARPGVGQQAFKTLIERTRNACWHQMFVSPTLSERDALVAVREKIAYSREGREVVGTTFQVRYAPASRNGDANSLMRELKGAFGTPSLVYGTRPIVGRESEATVVQWLNLTNDKGVAIATG